MGNFDSWNLHYKILEDITLCAMHTDDITLCAIGKKKTLKLFCTFIWIIR